MEAQGHKYKITRSRTGANMIYFKTKEHRSGHLCSVLHSMIHLWGQAPCFSLLCCRWQVTALSPHSFSCCSWATDQCQPVPVSSETAFPQHFQLSTFLSFILYSSSHLLSYFPPSTNGWRGQVQKEHTSVAPPALLLSPVSVSSS